MTVVTYVLYFMWATCAITIAYFHWKFAFPPAKTPINPFYVEAMRELDEIDVTVNESTPSLLCLPRRTTWDTGPR